MYEMMIWDYTQPTDPLDQEHCNKDLSTIDQFLFLSTARLGDDLLGALIHCYRGWNTPFDGQSRELVSLFWWTNPEDEAHFKNPREPNSLQGLLSTNDRLYEDRFSTIVERMQQKGWLSCKKHAHFHFAIHRARG